jgi:FkbH-like protein
MTIPEYFKAYQECNNNNSKVDFKAALLSSFTTKGLKEVMTVQAYHNGFCLDIYEGGYRQILQEVLNPGSSLYEYGPDIIYILWDTQYLLGDYYYNAYSMNENERRDYIELRLEEVIHCINFLSERFKGQIVMNNFQMPDFSPLGIVENKQKFGLFESVEYMNLQLAECFREKPSVYIYNYNHFVAGYGFRHIKDNKMYYLGDMKLELQLIPELARDYLSYINAFMAKNRKCLVLDLDNTLWGGVVGEVGIDGIKLGLEYEGKAYYEFQKYIYSLYLRGVLLAINSKNNPEDGMKVLHKHKYMVLREECFASIKINWNNKVDNIREIAQELNIGLDSMIFIDDDKYNCEMMRSILPQVKTVELPTNAVNYSDILKDLTDLNTLSFTKEDRERNSMYITDKKRKQLKAESYNIEEFLRNLDTKVAFEELGKGNVERAAQLTQKTNQFNLTTRRYTKEDLWRMREEGFHIYCIDVSDKYGNNGISGVIIYRLKDENYLLIDSMLLSCRVMGRRIEDHYFEFLIEEARKHRIKQIIGYYIPTNKNVPVKDLYEKQNFVKLELDRADSSLHSSGQEAETWVYYMD